MNVMLNKINIFLARGIFSNKFSLGQFEDEAENIEGGISAL